MQPQNSVELSTASCREIDALCDEFESAWKSGKAPSLSAFAAHLSDVARVPGLVELAILDAYYSMQSTARPSQEQGTDCSPNSTWHDYVCQFPELANVPVPEEFSSPSQEPLVGGRFRIMREHARGGLGRVSIAQDLDLGRDVAIKEMHPRFAQRMEYRQRFVREAEITGQLEHPSIVPIHVLGHRENGEPFYVMRFVQGRSMGEAIGEASRTLADASETVRCRQMLNRFVDVCRAVEYAHSRGVIHRDIKPDNIMLGDYNETLLVDWGLAKRLGASDNGPQAESQGADEAVEESTRAGTVLGTPAYMSPEQAEDPVRVDKRSDIYSLGATLSHLVTGRPNVSGSNDELASFATHSYYKPLLAVCRKAMATDPEQRYASTGQLADDVELVLADEPVDVCADPLATVARRWIRRHQSLAAATVTVVCLSLVAFVVISVIMQRNASQLRRKNRELDRLVEEATRFQDAAERSERRTQDAMSYLVGALRSPDPNRIGRDVTVADVLQGAVAQLDDDFKDDPLMAAQMLMSIGRTYHGLSMTSSALPLVERARDVYQRELGANDRLTLECEDLLAEIYRRLGNTHALELSHDVHRRSVAEFGPDAADTLRFAQSLAVQQVAAGQSSPAVRTLESLLSRAEDQPGDTAPTVISLRNDLANAYYANGQSDQATAMSRTVYEHRLAEFGATALSTIVSGSNLATHMLRNGSRKTAIAQLAELLVIARKSLGDDHYQTLVIMNQLGDCLLDENDTEQGFALIEESLQRSLRIYGVTNARTLVAANGLGRAYLTRGDYAKSIEKFEQVYRTQLEVHGPEHSETLTVANNLASAHRLNGDLNAAIVLFETTLAAQKKILREEHPDTLRSMLNLVATLQSASRPAESIPLCQDIYRIVSEQSGPDHGQAQTALSLEGSAHLTMGALDQAKTAFETCHASRARTIPDHWLRYHTMSQLGETLLRQENFEEAEPVLLEAYNELLKRKAKIPKRASFRLDQARQRLVDLYEASKMPDKAKDYRLEKTP